MSCWPQLRVAWPSLPSHFLSSYSNQVLRKAAGFSLPLCESTRRSTRHQVHLASEEDSFCPQCAPILHRGEPVPPPVLLWPRPVCRVAGEAGPGREPKGVKVEVFSSQAGSGVPGSLRGVPEAKWGVSGLGPEGPPAGVHREPPCEEWHSQVDQ